MKKKIYVLVVLILLLTGCGFKLEDEKCDAYLEKCIETILEEDKEAFIDLFWDDIINNGDTDWGSAANDIINAWKGKLEDYEMIGKNVNVKTEGFTTRTYTQCTYSVTTTEESYNVIIMRVEDKNGLDELCRFYFEKNYSK